MWLLAMCGFANLKSGYLQTETSNEFSLLMDLCSKNDLFLINRE